MNLMEPSFDPTVFTKNRKRLLEHRVGQALFDEVVMAAGRLGLLSDEHFTVDGTLIEAAASLKSFKPRDGDPPSTTDADGGNPSVDFHGERRSNTTHQSTTDPESRLLRKGKGKEARLVFMAHAMMENRNGMLTDFQRARSRVRRSAMRCRCSWTRRENEAFTPRPWAGTRTTTPASALLRCGSVESHPTWHRTRRVDRVPLTVGPLGMLGMPLASGRASGWKRSSGWMKTVGGFRPYALSRAGPDQPGGASGSHGLQPGANGQADGDPTRGYPVDPGCVTSPWRIAPSSLRKGLLGP